jgi:3-mercaptopyruvate sulfurtransferase SseA
MMRALALIAALLVSAGVAPQETAPQDAALDSPKLRVEWTEFKKLYDTNAVVVIDVRGDEAFEQGHIPGARSVPLARVAREAAQLAKLQKPIVTYCA